jgi:hypothetical protein
VSCDNCGADTTNGLALCQACRAWFLVNAEFIPVYYRNLSRWRPSSASGIRSVPGSREPHALGSSGTDKIGAVLDETHGDILRLTKELAGDRPQLARVVARISRMEEEAFVHLACALLVKYVDALTTLPWIRGIVTGISEIETTLREETERAVPGWYAGACKLCQTPTHVVPGLTWVTCQGCGATTHASDHLDTILTEAREWVARPLQIAEAVVALVDAERSVPRLHKRISKWGERGQIEVFRQIDGEGDLCGPKRFRFGDVLDSLSEEGRKAS